MLLLTHFDKRFWIGGFYLAIALFVSCVATSPVMAQAPDIDLEPLKKYDAAYNEWLERISFKCSFEVLHGKSDTLENGLQGKLSKVEQRITGSLIKLGKKMRYQKKYDGGPKVISDSAGQPGYGAGIKQVVNPAIDVLANSELVLYSDPDFHNMTLSEKEPDPLSAFDTDARAGGDVSPLVPWGGSPFCSPFRRLITASPFILKQSRVEPLADSRSLVVYRYQLDSGEIVVDCKATMDNSFEMPMLVSLVKDKQNSEVNHRTISHLVVSDFRPCVGGVAPARIVEASQVTAADGTSKGWDVRVWSSNDLGKEPATDADFLVKVPARTRVRNYKTFPERSTRTREIDFNKLTLEDVGSDGSENVPIAAESSSWIFKYSFVGLVLMGIMIVVWKRVKGRPNEASR